MGKLGSEGDQRGRAVYGLLDSSGAAANKDMYSRVEKIIQTDNNLMIK